MKVRPDPLTEERQRRLAKVLVRIGELRRGGLFEVLERADGRWVLVPAGGSEVMAVFPDETTGRALLAMLNHGRERMAEPEYRPFEVRR